MAAQRLQQASLLTLDTNFATMGAYSQSTHSLPAMAASTTEQLKRFQSSLEVGVHEKKKIVHQFTKTDLDSIENVCNFINNNSEPNLMELPGLKIKQQRAMSQSRDQVPSALRLKIFVHEEKVLKTTLKSKDMLVSSLNSSIVHKLKLSETESSHFCLCKRVEDEFFYIPPSDRVLDQQTNMFYLRLLRPLNTSLRHKLYNSKFDVRNCGNFAYKGRSNKRADSSCVKMVVNSSGIEINCDFILWKYVSQVSYSATFLQILYKQNQGLLKKKVCFDSEKMKPIYDLIMFFMEVERHKKVETKVESEIFKPKEQEETKFENFCKKLCSLTKDAVKSIGTPRRKRSKSIDSHSYQKPKKTKALNRSLSSTDMNRVKRNIFEDAEAEAAPREVAAPRSSSLATSGATKRKSETQLEAGAAPLKRTKIVTNPGLGTATATLPRQTEAAGGCRARTPVRMGVRSVAATKPPPPPASIAPPPPAAEERKIFYMTALRTDLAHYGVQLRVSAAGGCGAVFVAAVLRPDPASCKFVAGDRLLAVNGRSLENCSLDKAEHLIEASGHFVNFIISRKLN